MYQGLSMNFCSFLLFLHRIVTMICGCWGLLTLIIQTPDHCWATSLISFTFHLWYNSSTYSWGRGKQGRLGGGIIANHADVENDPNSFRPPSICCFLPSVISWKMSWSYSSHFFHEFFLIWSQDLVWTQKVELILQRIFQVLQHNDYAAFYFIHLYSMMNLRL